MDKEDKVMILAGIMIALIFAIIASIIVNCSIEYPEWFITILLIALESWLAYQIVKI